MYVFVFAHVVGEKCLSALEGFLPQARAGGGDPWCGLGWVQLRFSCQQQTPHGLNESQLFSCCHQTCQEHPKGICVASPWGAAGGEGLTLWLCGTTGEGTEIRCWLPAIHQPRNKENFKKQRLSLQANLFSEAGKELRRVCGAVSRIIYK